MNETPDDTSSTSGNPREGGSADTSGNTPSAPVSAPTAPRLPIEKTPFPTGAVRQPQRRA